MKKKKSKTKKEMKYEWKVHITKQNHIRILISIRNKKKESKNWKS